MGAVQHFFARGFIVGRGTFYSRSHVNSLQFQPIIHFNRASPVCVPSVEKCFHKEVCTPIPSEHSSSPIPAMRCWSKPYHKNRTGDISETWNRSAPVIPTQKLLLLHTSNRLAIFDQPATSSTLDNCLVQIQNPLHRQIRSRVNGVLIHESHFAHLVRSSNA